MDVLNYLKQILSPKHTTYKRRLESDYFEPPVEAKIRKKFAMGNMLSNSDGNPKPIRAATSAPLRRSVFLDPIKTKFDYSQVEAPIVIPDDDDNETPIPEHYSRRSLLKQNATSTPLIHKHKNGSAEMPFTKRPLFTASHERRSISTAYLHQTKPMQNGKRPSTFTSVKEFKLFNSPRKLSLKRNRPSRESILNESFRPDDKLRYEQLLRSTAPIANANKVFDSASFQQYVANSGLFTTRNKRLVDMGKRTNALTSNPTAFVDLTTSSKSSVSSTNRVSTRDSILKVLDDENNKDSDSDVEIVLPNPPSPKPDIQIDRVNSLKSLDPEDLFQSDWMKNLHRKSKLETEERKRNIHVQQEHLRRLNQIGAEIRTSSLNEEVNRCLRIKDIIVPEIEESLDVPLPTLTPEQETIINNALHHRSARDEVLSKKFSLAITRSHMLTLSGLEWLNDEVINFYMNLIIERGKLDKFPKVHAMNTFFYMRLNDVGYSGVKRWSKKYDVFSFDLMCVPIHLQMHWCMAVVDFRSKEINYYDSMGKPNNKCLDILFNYLLEEHKDKKKIALDANGWKLNNVKKIPQQMNGSDCGMFACTFAEFLARDAPITFSQENMPYLRRKAVIEIIEGKLLIS